MKRIPPSTSISPPAEKHSKMDERDKMVEKESQDRDWQPRLALARAGNVRYRCLISEILLIAEEAVLFEKRMKTREVIAYINELGADELQKWIKASHRGVDESDWEDFSALADMISPHTPLYEVTEEDTTMTDAQIAATSLSWESKYVGGAARALLLHIQAAMKADTTQIYARFSTIIQSSGMGKSRAVDEMSKEHLVIPMSLKEDNESGYPPGDAPVRRYLCSDQGQHGALIRAVSFLLGLFEEIRSVLSILSTLGRFPHDYDHDVLECGSDLLADKFRTYMRYRATYDSHGPFRQQFYQKVITRAKKSEQEYAPTDSPLQNLAESCQSLIVAVHAASPLQPDALIVLAVDDAHELATPRGSAHAAWSNFTELRRALHAIVNSPLFTLFLSTTGEVERFLPSPSHDPSGRIEQGLLAVNPPFVDLGFDHLAKYVSFQNIVKLSEITSIGHIAHYGRPLWACRYDSGDETVKRSIIQFAAFKLRGGKPASETPSMSEKLACLAHRIPIEFNPTSYTSHTQEFKQINVCLNVDTGIESMTSVSASEPILSEAACWMMQSKGFDVPETLKAVLSGYSVNQGDRGELLVMLLFTMARDAAVGRYDEYGMPPSGSSRWTTVPKFLSALFHAPTTSSSRQIDVLKYKSHHWQQTRPSSGHWTTTVQCQSIEVTFADSKVYFNHWVKCHQHALINARYLMRLIVRGAAVLCGTNQAGIDGVIPFLLKGDEIKLDNIGVILWQAKNDPSYTATPKSALFDAMDPYKCGIFERTVVDIPIIRIVFALAAKEPCLKIVTVPKTYDLWVGGLSSSNLRPVIHPELWQGLLQASYGWDRPYKVSQKSTKILRRSMNPGVAMDESHWQNWIDP